MSNGRFWIAMPGQPLKTAYVAGFVDSLWLCMMEPEHNMAGTVQSMIVSTSKTTVGEYVESLDKFYAEPMNRKIPIVFAMNWAKKKAGGASETELNEYEARCRAAASATQH